MISETYDTDSETLNPACVVHTHHAPCPRDGEPANPTPLHGDDLPGETAMVRAWADLTDQQRPLVVHHMGRGVDRLGHNKDGLECPCSPSVYPAREES
ncbi:hypothetical protein [Amycolatopsis sp. NPDC049159]|uniref:hypothetical protein n=1 Tax=Amycolatopsis sp. NPDC049159 TaxID=3157210 RepID=UPI0033E1533C